jgi:uncharacterized cupin superfamily protein
MPDDAPAAVTPTIRFDASAQKEPGKRMSSITHYQRGPFRTGFWAADPGRADIAYTKDELCTLLEGEVRITDAAGHAETYVAGDSFVIPKGFTGVWETVKPVRKFFAVFED